MNAPKSEPPDQLKKFKAAAKKLEADKDETRWKERLGKIAKQKPQAK